MLISAGVGGIANAMNTYTAYKDAKNYADSENKKITRATQQLDNLAVAEGANQQAAYTFAANMMRKFSSNPTALEGVSQIANQRLMDSTNRATQLRTAAVDMFSKRVATPRKPEFADYAKNFLTGAIAGAPLGVEVAKSLK